MQEQRRHTSSKSAECSGSVRFAAWKSAQCSGSFGCAAWKPAQCSSSVRNTASKSANCSSSCSWGAANSFSRCPNGLLQVYIIAMATLITISNCDRALAAARMQFSPVGANDHLGNLHHFHQSVHLQHFEKFSAEVKAEQEDGQPERLAVENDRLDPLHHFKRYKGGYNLKSKHYWASTLFTGIHGYFLGTFWLLGGIVGVIIALYIRYYHVRKKALQIQPFHKSSMISVRDSKMKLVPMILATILTTLIICCCGVACVGSQRFHSMAKQVETTLIIEGADNATRLIRIVTQMMGQMKIDIEPYDQGVAQRLDNTTFKLNKASITLINTLDNHKNSLDSALLGLNVGVITIAVINIVLWTGGLVGLYLFPRFRRAFLMIIALVWLLVFVNWVTFGITFFLSNFADDTCKALKEYEQSSKNTTLDNVLPCHNLASGSNTVFRFRQKIYNYIEEANKDISKLNYKQRHEKMLNEDSSEMATKDIPHVCNPFLGPPTYPTNNNNSCRDGTISMSSLPQLLSFFKCPSSSTKKTNKTRDQECISTRQYNIASAYISATQKLLNLLPDVENLTGCTFVVDTFTIILQKQCKPLKHSIRMVWVSMVLLAAITTLTMILWLLQLWIVSKFKFYSLKCGGTIIPHDHSPLPP